MTPADESRWDTLSRRPYQAVAWAAWLLALALRFVHATGIADLALSLLGLAVAVFGAVLLIGPRLHRGFRLTREEAVRDPLGRERHRK
jgi:hypothetical protein